VRRLAVRLAALFLLWNLLAGCVVKLHARDPLTLDAIDATARNRAVDAARVQAVLAKAAQLAPNDDERTYFRVVAADLASLERSEQTRLKSWRWREEQKTDPETP
jgi:hypothetical protein